MFIDISGQKFGKWFVILRTNQKKIVSYYCICECGTERSVLSGSLRTGKSISCGCHQKENRENFVNLRKIYKSTYTSWAGMRQRCNYPKHNEYHRYGGRGIKYDPAWDSFEKFLEDMGQKPQGCSIDRIDNNDNYNKINCKWSTKHEQSSNTCRNVFVEYEGNKFTLKNLAKHINVNYDLLHKWYRDKKLTLDESIFRAKNPKPIGYNKFYNHL